VISTHSASTATRRKVFISYFRADKYEVEAFVHEWATLHGVFIPQIVGAYGRDLINSDDAEYVIGRIRREYIVDSTVTIVLVGSCTHSRRHVDWEIKASLRQGETMTPNGLLGIVLPSRGPSSPLPPRFEANWNPQHHNCYARYYRAPASADVLRMWIEDAFSARTLRANLIQNPTDTMRYNARCRFCNLTHSISDNSANSLGTLYSLFMPAQTQKRCYVLNFNQFATPRDQLTAFLDTKSQILNWYGVLPCSLVIVSRLAVHELSNLVRECLPQQTFFIASISETDGWMPHAFWEFINNPNSSGLWEPV
jgi:hypothetical protein